MVMLSGFWAALTMRHTGYFLVALAVGLFLFFLFRHSGLRNFIRERGAGHRWGILTVLVCGSFLHIHEHHVFFVQYDESVLLMTSRLMHEDRQAALATKSHYLNGRLVFHARYVDKRPILFPFLVSVVHDVTGYRPANSYVVNALCGFLFLGGIYALLANWFGTRYGIFGVLFAMTLPLLAQNATGGGFDLLNASMIALLLNLGVNYARRPDPLNQNLFVLGLILLAQARYESIFFLIPGALIVLSTWFRERRIHLTWTASLAPLLLLSPLLSIRVFTTVDQFKQLGEENERFFELGNVPDNFGEAVYYFFQANQDATNSPLLSVFGFISLVFCLVLLFRRVKVLFRRPDEYTVFYTFLAVVLFNTVWALTNFWGQFTDPIVARVTLPLHLMLILATAIAAKEFFKARSLPRWIPVFIGIWFAGYTLPAYSRAYETQNHVTSRTAAMAIQWAKENTDRHDFFIAPSTLPLIIHNRPAISDSLAVFRAARIIRSRELGFYNNIYLVSELKLDQNLNLQPMDEEELFDIFELELLHTERFRPHVASQIFRVVDLKPGVEEWEDLERLRQRKVPVGDNVEEEVEGVIFLLEQLP